MKPLPWAKSALALCIMGTLTACGGGGSSSAGEGDIADLPEPPPVVVVPPEESGISNTPLPLVENFGEYTGFDQSDTIDFFSPNYKALATADSSEYEDARPALYYPTCCFFDQDDPSMEITVDSKERLGIVSDAGDASLLISNARFSIGQTLSDMAADGKDPKKDSTPGSDGGSGWGELDLSEPYRISFCVASASGSGSKTQIYVDNNTSSEADSIHGGGSLGSRIFDVETGSLVPGERVVINIPGETYLQAGGDVVDIKDAVIGTQNSFLQLRVSSGGTAIIDDLLIEKQSEDGQADLPACTVFEPAVAPDAPKAPTTFATDAQMAVSWGSVLGAASYDLAYGTTDDVSAAEVMSGLTETSTTLTELENGTTYYVWVRGVNNVGPSEWSASATGTPEAPVGDNCTPTTSVDPSATNAIIWSVYDGCTHPGDLGAVVINGSEQTNFSFADEELKWFEVSPQGIMELDTLDGDSETKPVGDLDGIVADGAYPKHFTWIARIDNAKAESQGARGFEIETHIDDRRMKAILRPDSGKLQIEKFLPDEETAEVSDLDFTDGYHTYQINFTVNDPAAGADNINAVVYRDGVEVGNFTGPGRSGGSASLFRIGEGSGSAFHANLDWLVWSDNGAAAVAADQLVGELPGGIGELDVYAGADASAAFEENFNGVGLVEDSDTEDTNFFDAAYRAQSGDASKPMFNVTSGGSRITVAGGTLALHNARFSIGDALHGTDTAETDTAGRGDLDLSKPYVISFDVVENPNVSLDSGKCQVYVDNNTSSSGKSVHGGDSKVFEAYAAVMADGDQPEGTVTIASDPDAHIGTANSFLQIRCDSGTEDKAVVIDNFKVSYQ
ncbi:fibronectin type III domain-containing protein [Microbulbifer sp. HZ11]|uniref:fibronectin type III domain-containing protein n=1 Tax=Microbulbifer sp. HZ11 TaxID=1453501 RepID=UPI0005BBE755|nr:fibronectin type III domain-containing protein [Microbulbifer sp. HZ11]